MNRGQLADLVLVTIPGLTKTTYRSTLHVPRFANCNTLAIQTTHGA
jgi:hypothetical protein